MMEVVYFLASTPEDTSFSLRQNFRLRENHHAFLAELCEQCDTSSDLTEIATECEIPYNKVSSVLTNYPTDILLVSAESQDKKKSA